MRALFHVLHQLQHKLSCLSQPLSEALTATLKTNINYRLHTGFVNE